MRDGPPELLVAMVFGVFVGTQRLAQDRFVPRPVVRRLVRRVQSPR